MIHLMMNLSVVTYLHHLFSSICHTAGLLKKPTTIDELQNHTFTVSNVTIYDVINTHMNS